MISITQNFIQYGSTGDAMIGDVVIHPEYGLGEVCRNWPDPSGMISVQFDRDQDPDNKTYPVTAVPFKSVGLVRAK